MTELVAKLTGQLDEGTRVNVLIQEREQREAGAVADLRRLDIGERLELARLLAKARGSEASSALEVSATATIPPRKDSPINSSTLSGTVDHASNGTESTK